MFGVLYFDDEESTATLTGIKWLYFGIKFYPPPNTSDRMPDPFCGVSARMSSWTISQCTSFIKEPCSRVQGNWDPV